MSKIPFALFIAGLGAMIVVVILAGINFFGIAFSGGKDFLPQVSGEHFFLAFLTGYAIMIGSLLLSRRFRRR